MVKLRHLVVIAGRSPSALQHLIDPAKGRIGQNRRLPFFEPSPVFCAVFLYFSQKLLLVWFYHGTGDFHLLPNLLPLTGNFEISSCRRQLAGRPDATSGPTTHSGQAAAPVPGRDGILAPGMGRRDVGSTRTALDAVEQGVDACIREMAGCRTKGAATDGVKGVVYSAICVWIHALITGLAASVVTQSRRQLLKCMRFMEGLACKSLRKNDKGVEMLTFPGWQCKARCHHTHRPGNRSSGSAQRQEIPANSPYTLGVNKPRDP